MRLIDQPMTKEPLNKLGFDPILSMPPLEELRELLLRERRAIKALILDQVSSTIAELVLISATG